MGVDGARHSSAVSATTAARRAWTTGRAGIGGVVFAKGPDDVRDHAARMLAMKVGQFPVEAVLVEEKIDIEREFFLSFAIDDAARAPVIIFAAGGGSADMFFLGESHGLWCVNCTAYNSGERGFDTGVLGDTSMNGGTWARASIPLGTRTERL